MAITFGNESGKITLTSPLSGKSIEEVYVGNSAPTDNKYKVWVKPDEEGTTELASKSYVDEAIDAIEIPEGENVDLSNYYTKQEVEKVIDDAIDTIELLEGAPGKDGEDGKDYVLTAADKQEIANLVSSSFVDGEGVSY